MSKPKNNLQMDVQKDTPWQIKLFSKTLKKKMKISALKKLIGDTTGMSCLLITCGDNNGVLNYYIKETGGRWSWADLEEKCIGEMEQFLGEPVVQIDKSTCNLSFPDNSFDCVATIDCHEHLDDPTTFNQEIKRVTKANGRVVVTVPNGDETKLATRIKNLIGMTKEKYGHVVEGYDIHELKDQLSHVGLKPGRTDSYSRFFTEIIELAINFAYVKFLSKKGDVEVEKGTIAPSNEEQLRSIKKTYKLYSYIYPVIWALSLLDYMFFFTTGYAVLVEGKKA